MNILVVLALTIVAVSAKSVTNQHLLLNPEFTQTVDKLKEEFKGVDAAIKADPATAAHTLVTLMSEIDADVRRKLGEGSAKTITAILDTTKPLGQRLNEVADLAQHTADQWKLAAKKYNDNHPSVTENVVDAEN